MLSAQPKKVTPVHPPWSPKGHGEIQDACAAQRFMMRGWKVKMVPSYTGLLGPSWRKTMVRKLFVDTLFFQMVIDEHKCWWWFLEIYGFSTSLGHDKNSELKLLFSWACQGYKYYCTPPQMIGWNMRRTLGRGDSFWKPLFSGSTSFFQGSTFLDIHSWALLRIRMVERNLNAINYHASLRLLSGYATCVNMYYLITTLLHTNQVVWKKKHVMSIVTAFHSKTFNTARVCSAQCQRSNGEPSLSLMHAVGCCQPSQSSPLLGPFWKKPSNFQVQTIPSPCL